MRAVRQLVALVPMFMVLGGCERKAEGAQVIDALAGADSAADERDARDARIAAAVEARTDSIGRERMRDVMSGRFEPPPSAPVRPVPTLEDTPEYREARQYLGQGPSFRCTATLTPLEQAICGDPYASALDRAVSIRSNSARQGGRTLNPDDATWRATQLPPCMTSSDPVGCLRDAMVARLRGLPP